MSLWRGTREQRAFWLVFDTHLKASCFSSVQVPVVVSNRLLVFAGYSLPHPCLRAKTPSLSLYLLSPSLLRFSSSPHSSSLSFAQSALPPSLFSVLFLFLYPSIPSGQQVWVEVYCCDQSLITCILDSHATWGHTLPKDRSIHAGGKRETQGPAARSGVGSESVNYGRREGGGVELTRRWLRSSMTFKAGAAMGREGARG